MFELDGITAVIWFWRLTFGVFAIAPGIMALGCSRNWLRGQRTKRWLFTNGTVIESRLIEYPGDPGFGDSTLFALKVRYEYEVAEKLFFSDRISFGSSPFYKSKETAQSVADKIAVGSQVKVFYDPKQPSDATLEIGSSDNLLQMVAFLLMSGFGTVCLWVLG